MIYVCFRRKSGHSAFSSVDVLFSIGANIMSTKKHTDENDNNKIGIISSDGFSMSISLIKKAIGIIDNHITIITILFDNTLAINPFNPNFFLISGHRLKL